MDDAIIIKFGVRVKIIFEKNRFSQPAESLQCFYIIEDNAIKYSRIYCAILSYYHSCLQIINFKQCAWFILFF